MDRSRHPKYVPNCPRHAAQVDQYMWPQKDTNKYMCFNGISHPIYDCKGWVSYSLPLEEYPPADGIHPQIAMTGRLHLNDRDERFRSNYGSDERMEGFYMPRDRFPVIGVQSDRVPGYPLPSPHGDTKSSRSCM